MEAKLKANGLESAFTDQTGPGAKKEAKRKAGRKKAFLDEIITLKLVNIDGEDIKGCLFRIMRRRLTQEYIQEQVDKCPQPCKVDYVYNKAGEVIWFKDLQLAAEASSYYVIVPLQLRIPFDILKDPHYEGQTIFALQYIPFYCRDELTVVDAAALKEWLIAAILEEDPYIPPLKMQIEKQEQRVKDVDRKLKQVVKQEFLDPNGKPMPQEQAEAEREAMFKVIGEEREKQEKELKRRHELLETHRLWRKSSFYVLIIIVFPHLT
jgi:hypothetical protein